ncbi:Bulb-type lectin domain-containing protein [Plasmodiophora brassicae]
MQPDGNLVVYATELSMKPVWAANHGEKANEGPFQVKLQSDGNLVVTQGKGQPIWTSGTMNMGEAPRELVVQDDGNLVIYDSAKKPIWATKTNTFGSTDPSTIPVPASTGPSPYPSVLNAGGTLSGGQSLISPNERVRLDMQRDGNLVLYAPTLVAKPLWATNHGEKASEGPFLLRMQDDGNLVIYEAQGKSIWATGTDHKGVSPHRLVVQDDGNLVVYDSRNTTVWASNTARFPSQ